MRGHVRRRGKKYCFVLDMGRDPETGKRQQKWFSGFESKDEAEKAMIAKIHEINQGMFVKPNKMTLGEYLENWLQDYAQNALRPTTFDSYSYLVRRHIIPSLGFLTLEKLQATHIQRFYSKMLKSGLIKNSGGLSPGTVRKIHGILRIALNHAVKWQLVNRNVATLAEPPKNHKKEIATLDLKEVKQLLFNAQGDRYYIAFLLAVTTGLRRGEILGLRWKDVDMEAGMASIRKNLVMVNNKPVLHEPKTNRSVRMITLPSMVLQALKEHREIQNQEKIKAGAVYQDHDLIVTTHFGTPVIPQNLWKRLKEILMETGLPDIRFHDLRHTHATLLLKQGEHPKIVSERLGHSSISTTLDTYSHVVPNMQYETVERFEKMFFHDDGSDLT